MFQAGRMPVGAVSIRRIKPIPQSRIGATWFDGLSALQWQPM
jgi:hypothetical protein